MENTDQTHRDRDILRMCVNPNTEKNEKEGMNIITYQLSTSLEKLRKTINKPIETKATTLCLLSRILPNSPKRNNNG